MLIFDPLFRGERGRREARNFIPSPVSETFPSSRLSLTFTRSSTRALFPTSPTAAGTMGRPHLTDDERLRVRVLRLDAGWTFTRIEQVTGYGARQIRNAMRSGTVGKRSGRPTALSPEQEAELIRFVTANKDNRSMSFANIAKAVLGGQFGEYAIRNTLRRNGFKRSGPVLKQMPREREEATPVEEPVSVAGAPPVGAHPVGAAVVSAAGGSMEGVTRTEPGGPREEYPTDDEMLTEDEGHAGEQVRGEGGASPAGVAAAGSQPAAGDGAAAVDESVARDLAAAVNAVSEPAVADAAQDQEGKAPAQTLARAEIPREPSQAPSSIQTVTPREPSQAPPTVQTVTPREPSQAPPLIQTDKPPEQQ